MNEREQDNRARDLKIAENEEKRELASDIRLSTWAIGIAAVFGLAVLMFFLIKK